MRTIHTVTAGAALIPNDEGGSIDLAVRLMINGRLVWVLARNLK